MSTLIDRLSAATGGSQELDIDILRLLEGYSYEKRGRDRANWLYGPNGRCGYDSWNPVPDRLKVTRSLDAALALAERVLGGWWWSVSSERIGEPEPRPFAACWLSDGEAGALKTARAATPALAICIAILQATGASK